MISFCRSRRKGSALKNLAGALHTGGGACTLSVGREVKMGIQDKLMIYCSHKVRKRKFRLNPRGRQYYHSGY